MNNYLVITTVLCCLFLSFFGQAFADENNKKVNLADTAETLKAMRLNVGLKAEQAQLVLSNGEVLSASEHESGSLEFIIRHDSTLYSCEVMDKRGRCWKVIFE